MNCEEYIAKLAREAKIDPKAAIRTQASYDQGVGTSERTRYFVLSHVSDDELRTIQSELALHCPDGRVVIARLP